jgi:hypothetical protein
MAGLLANSSEEGPLLVEGSLECSANCAPPNSGQYNPFVNSRKCPKDLPQNATLCPVMPAHQWSGIAELSLLAWQAREEGLVFAVKNNPNSALVSDDLNVNGILNAPHFSWAPGLKLNFDVGFTNTWDLDVRWTTYYSKSSNSLHATTNSTTGSGIFPIFYLPTAYATTPTLFGKAHGIWQVHLNTGDIELGIAPRITPRLNLRFHGGLKYTSIFQHFSATYSNGLTEASITPLTSRGAASLQYKGGGPRIGLQSDWKLSRGWSILANCAGTISLGQFQYNRDDSDAAVNGGTSYLQTATFHESVYVFRPIFEILMGFNWAMTYGKRDQNSFNLDLAYEVQYYFSQNMISQLAAQQMAFDAFQSRADLHFHGVTLNFRFGF